MVDGVTRVEDDGGVVQHLHLLLTKLTCGEPFNLDERVEHKLYAKFASYFKIRRLIRRGLGL